MPIPTSASTMSSETSTEQGAGSGDASEFQAWQLFLLAGLTAATGLVFLQVFVWRADRPSAVLLSLVVLTASFAGYAAYRTLMPLARTEEASLPDVDAGGRTRVALDREKTLVLRSIKDLEFDRAMGKLAEKDFTEMSARLRARAVGLLRQLDRGSSYRDQIEKELIKRIGVAPATVAESRACGACQAANDVDATFCKKCGARLEAA